MDNLCLYEVNPKYVEYVLTVEKHMFHNKKDNQKFSRKYIGIVLSIGEFNYFAPLSSFKDKHRKMKEGLDFIKVKDYAVINLNNMFPVPIGEYVKVDIGKETDFKYRDLLLAEYRFIRSIQNKIRKNASNLYKIKTGTGDVSKLTKRCNDFLLLEKMLSNYFAKN